MSVPWQQWVANLNENAPVQVKTKIHVCLLHLLVKLANEPYVRSNHAEKMKALLVQAEHHQWNLIEPAVHQKIMDWYVMSCDPIVLFGRDPQSLDVRILEYASASRLRNNYYLIDFFRFLKVASGYSKAFASVSQALLEKRRTFIRSYVKLIAVFSSRHKASIHSKEADLNRVISTQLGHLEVTVQDEAEMQILLAEFLSVLNLNDLSKINETCFTLWIRNQAGDGAVIRAFLKVLPEACVNCDLTAVLLESCITSYFQNRSANVGEPLWKEIVEVLKPYPPRLTELEHVLVCRGCVLTLHVLLEQRAIKSADPLSVMNIAQRWLEEIKVR